MLAEGVKYPFIVKGIINNINELSSSWVLEDPYGAKHLVETASYHGYHFETGQKIICKIDHINCNGHIFIEPPHPYYIEGFEYYLKFLGVENWTNHIGYSQKAIKLSGYQNIICWLPLGIRSVPEIKKRILKCRVDIISKGQIILSSGGLLQKAEMMKHKPVIFKIIGMFKATDDNTYYVVADDYGDLYFIDAYVYAHYRFTVGQSFHGVPVRMSSNSTWVIEPQHPFYQPGNTYKFNLLQHSVIFDIEGRKCQLFNSIDILGKRVSVPAEKAFLAVSGSFFWYKIEKIRNGLIYTGF